MNYYNEFDPKAAAWLRELIKEGHIANGVVDERSISDVKPEDLHGFTQCHFFAGIGGWSYALRLAGVPDDEPIWTGSCPCQPFSAAGQQKGTRDARHLWPDFFRLIAKCNPSIIFGEQVASKLGREWLNGVRTDLEGMEYAVGDADLCAASVGSPHIRQRLWWVAYTDGGDSCPKWVQRSWEQRQQQENSKSDRLEHSQSNGREQWGAESSGRSIVGGRGAGGMEHTLCERRARQSQRFLGASNQGNWSNFDILRCTDGKARRVESSTFPLANGVSGRVGLLRGYGNAIVPQVAEVFIRSCFEALFDVRSDVLMSDPLF